jgi:hypothetical protein
MNTEQRQLRLKDLGPLKDAINEAYDLAVTLMPPLHRRGEYGMAPWGGLDRCIERVHWIEDKDLVPFCKEFRATCQAADKQWFEALRKLKQAGDEYPALDSIKAKYAESASTFVGEVRKWHGTLSKHLEALLA